MPRKKSRRRKNRRRRNAIALAILGALALIGGLWYFTQSREIKVWVYTDYAFRQDHQEWPGLIEARFREVNRIYQRSRTGIRWKVLDAGQVDPTATIDGIDNRRTNMALHLDRPADIFVVLSGVRQGKRTGSVSPFTRVAVVVDFPDKSEALNSRLLAHELSHLFGAPYDPTWFDTLMAGKPTAEEFTPRTLTLIRHMRNYPFDRGIEAIADGSWEKKALTAVSEDDVAAHTNPMAHAHTVLATALLNERKTSQALAQLKAAAEADPKNKTMHLNLAEGYTREGQYEKALDEAREAVRLAPDDPLTHRALGALFGKNQQPEAALKELQVAIKLQPDNAQNQVLLGLEYASMFGHLDDAVAALQEATRTDPNWTIARTDLEQAETLRDKVQEEIARERTFIHDHPDDPGAHYRLAKAEARAGDLKNAIADMQKAAELRPDSVATHTGLAEFYLVEGDAGTAWAEIGKVRALGTEPPASLLARMPPQK